MTHLQAIKKKIRANLKRQKEAARGAPEAPMVAPPRYMRFQIRPMTPRARLRRDALLVFLEMYP